MQDTEQFIKTCAQRYNQEVSKDYFIYHAFQYEFCLKAKNRKQFVVVNAWLERASGKEATQQRDDVEDFPTALHTMCAWYGENYPAFRDTQPLTFACCYFYLPVALSFVHEAHTLWEKLHSTPPPVYDTRHDFWRALLAVVQDKCQHQHLLLAWLHWRYGERQAPTISAANLPPNPFVERRTFGMRRGNERRPFGARRSDERGREGAGTGRGTRRDGGAWREDTRATREPRSGTRGTESGLRRGESTHQGARKQPRDSEVGEARQRDNRGREHAGNQRQPRRESIDSHAVSELTDALSSEIKQAVAIMQGDGGHPGVTLQPANSFYRRLQHKMVADLGFTSISVGDDRESRAVKIVRDA